MKKKLNQSKKKSLIFKKISSLLPHFSAGLIFLFLAGCADRQWQDPLEKNAEKAIRSLLQQELQNRQACTCCIDAEITAKWDTQLSDGGLNGYLQVMLPSSIKVVAINPLGQPLYALTSDGKRFQAINVEKGLYKHGRISTFTDKHDIPENVFHKEWANWLTGSMNFTTEQVIDIREDVQARGVWLHVVNEGNETLPDEYLLFDFSSRKLLERIGFDNDGDKVAHVIYQGWTTKNNCPLPTEIKIQGIAYDTEILIELKDILNDQVFTPPTFKLKLPPNYLQQYYP